MVPVVGQAPHERGQPSARRRLRQAVLDVDCYYPTGTPTACAGVENIAAVGTVSLGAGYWGQLDMAGEMFEWTLDSYANYVDPSTDAAYLNSSPSRAIRGGPFNSATSFLRPPTRFSITTNRYNFVGFRCARSGGSANGSSDGGSADTGPGDSGSGDSNSGDSGNSGTSCRTSGPGLSSCGVIGESCCISLEVPGGTYFRTYTNSGGGATGLADPATVSGFQLDKYLVTVGRFRQFVSAWSGGYYPSAGSGIHTYLNGGLGLANSGSPGTYETGWDATDWNNTTYLDPTNANLASCSPYGTWTNTSTDGQESLPINCVNWYEAYAFCIWDGGFLPSEAEWEYAAAGGSQQFEYPWGSVTPGTACPGPGCAYAIYSCDYPSGPGGCTGIANIAPVGYASLGAGYWGQLDLAGEVWEWNLDWYSTPYVDPCTDCAYVTTASGRVVQGGYFGSPTTDLLTPDGNDDDPTYRVYDVGFRCARAP